MLYKEALELCKTADFRLRFHGKGVPVYRQLWKWLTSNSRATKLGIRQALKQQAELPDMDVKEFVKQMGLPEEYSRKILLDPLTAENFLRSRYDFLQDHITNKPPVFFAFANSKVKPTDLLKHEAGHAKTKISGQVGTDDVIKRMKPPLSTAWQRLLHPETSDLVKFEDMADMEAFGQGGKLSWHKQLRHHPNAAGYRAVARVVAGTQLAANAAGLGIGGYGAYRFFKNRKDKQEGK